MKILLLLFLIAIFHLSGCSLPQQADSQNSTLENKTKNITSESSTPANKPVNVADENFAKEAKSKYEATAAELERNRRLWQEGKIVNYDFVASKSAGGNTNGWNRLPVLIKIREGQKVSVEKVEKDKDYVIYSRTDGFEDFDTIDKLFNYMRQELDDGNIIEAKYDKKFGYPISVGVIFTFLHTHNSRGIEISKFEVIN